MHRATLGLAVVLKRWGYRDLVGYDAPDARIASLSGLMLLASLVLVLRVDEWLIDWL